MDTSRAWWKKKSRRYRRGIKVIFETFRPILHLNFSLN